MKAMDFKFEGTPVQPPQKSTFVNVLAWIFIIFGGFSTIMSILQSIMIHMLFPREELNLAIQQAQNAEQLPAFFGFMFNNVSLFFIFIFIVSAVSFISAIALLKRKNWARIIFIFLMTAGIVWNIGGVIVQFSIYNSIQEASSMQAPPPEFKSMLQIMKIASVIMMLAMTTLFGVVIKKLTSKSIKDEFNQ
nr:hypothetical protein [uncultured Desulfuromonas sp.]